MTHYAEQRLKNTAEAAGIHPAGYEALSRGLDGYCRFCAGTGVSETDSQRTKHEAKMAVADMLEGGFATPETLLARLSEVAAGVAALFAEANGYILFKTDDLGDGKRFVADLDAGKFGVESVVRFGSLLDQRFGSRQ